MYELPDDHESSAFAFLDALWADRVSRRQAAQTTQEPEPEAEETQDSDEAAPQGVPGEIAREAGGNHAPAQDLRDVARIKPVFGQPPAQIEGPKDGFRP